jgi:3-oxoacyl-[acyl-carrier-protein] synthase-3
MMAAVAQKLLAKANLNVSQIDRIICSADPPDSIAPNTAVSVQRLLGAYCPAFDVQMSCVGWLCGVDLASRCILTGEKRILILAGCQIGSRSFFYNRMHRAIFGDGAGGVLLEASTEESKILSIGLWSDGRYYDKIHIPYPWSKLPDSIPAEYSKSFFMSPTQEDFFATMDFYLRPFTQRLWREAGVEKNDIDVFLMHQPSMPLFEYSLKALDIPRPKTLNYFAKYGNLVAAELPVYISEALKTGEIKKGQIVFALTYGAGFTMGGMVIKV